MLDWLRGSKVDHPLADPKESRRIIDEIPSQDPLKALGEINFWLDSIDRTDGFRVDRRFELLDALDQAAKKHVTKLSLDYLPLRQQKFQENRIWTTVVDFWRHVGSGYVVCVEGFQAGASGSGAIKAQLPVVVGRALRASAVQLKWSLLRYGPVDGSVWGDLGRMYAFAESKGLADTVAAIYPGKHGESSATRELLKALLLAIGSAESLVPTEIEIAERTIAFFSRLYVLDLARGGARTHYFDLAMRRVPARAVASAEGPSLRFFGAGACIDELNRLTGVALQEGALPSDIALGAEYDVASVTKVWRHLVSYWSPTPPARTAERRPSNTRLTVVDGFERLMTSLDPREDDSLDFSGGGAKPTIESESWVAENASDTGFGAIVPAVKSDWVKVGSLAGVQSEGASHWGVAVVRRISRDNDHNLHVGLQLIARAGIPVRLSPAATVSSFTANRMEQRAILLQARPDENHQVSILMRMGSFAPNQSMEMRVQGKVFLIMPARLLEGSEAYDIGRFKVLERIS